MTTRAPVLIIEDEYTMVRALTFLLRREGFSSRVARDGVEALQAVDELMPKIMLLDLDLPRLNGFEVCSRVRALPQGDKAYIIALTASPQDEDRRRILELGADEFLTKPFDPLTLVQRLREITHE